MIQTIFSWPSNEAFLQMFCELICREKKPKEINNQCDLLLHGSATALSTLSAIRLLTIKDVSP